MGNSVNKNSNNYPKYGNNQGKKLEVDDQQYNKKQENQTVVMSESKRMNENKFYKQELLFLARREAQNQDDEKMKRERERERRSEMGKMMKMKKRSEREREKRKSTLRMYTICH